MESQGLTVNLSEAFHDRSNLFHVHVPPIVVHAQLHGQWQRGEELCTFACLRLRVVAAVLGDAYRAAQHLRWFRCLPELAWGQPLSLHEFGTFCTRARALLVSMRQN